MEVAASKQMTGTNSMSLTRFIIIKAVSLTVITVILGLAQVWAATESYKPNQVAGFYLGLLHGTLMPAALPGLLLGNDPPIYAPGNSGRPYKIGYILGLNTCGTVFFGVAFWRPRGWRWDQAWSERRP